jgi:ABC-2 type transport system permease protein
MLLRLAQFEFVYFSRQRSFILALLIFFFMPFMATTSVGVQIGGFSNANINSPHNITDLIMMMSMLGMFMAAVFVGDTATRDMIYRMDGFVLSTTITKTDFLWGRLLGTYAFCLVVFATVPLGILVGTLMPFLDPETLGETRLFPPIFGLI